MRRRSASLIHMADRPEAQTTWERVDQWINVKGQVSTLVGHILKWALAAGSRAALLYLYQHWHEWFWCPATPLTPLGSYRGVGRGTKEGQPDARTH